MKLIAHRGWAQGPEENSLAAFERAAGTPTVSGVEFDVRAAPSGGLVVSHDPVRADDAAVSIESALAFLAETRLELFVELKQPAIAAPVLDLIEGRGLSARATVFGFPGPAASLPWAEPRRARLGVAAAYPWQALSLARRLKPDVLLLGWDERPWTRVAFRACWSVFSLAAFGQRVSAAVVVGVAQRADDLDWLGRQGIEAAVADMDAPALNGWRR